MSARSLFKPTLGVLALALVPVMTGAQSNGCGGDVVVGSEDPCVVTGCSGQMCADTDQASTCEWSPAYECYDLYGTCERATDGTCGWAANPELEACLANGGPDQPCVVTGCSGQLCADAEQASTCEWTDAYACYGDVGICERDANGACGWRDTPELAACLADPRTPATGACVRNSNDACSGDADCTAGGCGGELCFNPSLGEGVSTCDCTTPAAVSCGCVNGQCTWWE
jgi:hypothetical protein